MKFTRYILKPTQRFLQIALSIVLLLSSVSIAWTNAERETSTEYEQPVPSDDQEEGESSDETVMMAYDAVVPVAQINIDHFFYLIREWKLSGTASQFITFDCPDYVSSHFKTLFKRLISPNAP